MKKILIFRSSNLVVLDRLLTDINKKFPSDCEIHMVVQNELYEKLKNKYSYIKYIKFSNGFFSYSNYVQDTNLYNMLTKQQYDYIYIPISTNNIDSCKEIEMISSTIIKKSIYIFTCDFKYHKRINNIVFLKLKKVAKSINSYIANIMCLIIYKISIEVCIIYSRINRRKNVR